MVTIPRVLIAGTESGVGKTTVATGLMAALTQQGLQVQPFKAGPDYIDPTYHAVATGRIPRNLDTWLLRRRQVQGVFQHAVAGAQLAVIEGVMGLFDGHAGTNDRGSTAELAALLRAPVILVVDASRMARSIAALVNGYASFDRRITIAGVIVNKVSERHYQLLRAALQRYTRAPVLGYVPSDPSLAVPERHLGLVPAVEDPALRRVRKRLAAAVSEHVALDRVLAVARRAPSLSAVPWMPAPPRRTEPSVRIGLARDEAFHFYYQENLDLLRAYGAELVEFSPLRDEHLPPALDGLYLGGGFPERFARQLEHNASLRGEVRSAIRAGIPTYAECGGLMYLVQRLHDHDGRACAMVGALPGSVRMTRRLQSFGYVTVTPRRRNVLADPSEPIKGHEFHYSVWDYAVPPREAAYQAVRHRTERYSEGFARENLLASYIHVHFLTNPRWARGLVAAAQRWQQA